MQKDKNIKAQQPWNTRFTWKPLLRDKPWRRLFSTIRTQLRWHQLRWLLQRKTHYQGLITKGLLARRETTHCQRRKMKENKSITDKKHQLNPLIFTTPIDNTWMSTLFTNTPHNNSTNQGDRSSSITCEVSHNRQATSQI